MIIESFYKEPEGYLIRYNKKGNRTYIPFFAWDANITLVIHV